VIQLTPLVMLAGGRGGEAWARRRPSARALRHAQSRAMTRPHTGVRAYDCRRLCAMLELVRWLQALLRIVRQGSAVRRPPSQLADGGGAAPHGGMPRGRKLVCPVRRGWLRRKGRASGPNGFRRL
jgi:hypothetical protein